MELDPLSTNNKNEFIAYGMEKVIPHLKTIAQAALIMMTAKICGPYPDKKLLTTIPEIELYKTLFSASQSIYRCCCPPDVNGGSTSKIGNPKNRQNYNLYRGLIDASVSLSMQAKLDEAVTSDTLFINKHPLHHTIPIDSKYQAANNLNQIAQSISGITNRNNQN